VLFYCHKCLFSKTWYDISIFYLCSQLSLDFHMDPALFPL
jgi:hypothetical protein